MRRILPLLAAVALLVVACSPTDPIAAPDLPATRPGSEPADPPADGSADSDADAGHEAATDPGPVSFLTGLPVEAEVLDRPLLLVKIENSPNARPQTGLDAADVVYEELVEGGITRFLAVFHSELPESVGPTRSARPVDAQLISGYGASGFVYSGARQEVRTMLSATPAVRITEGGPGFHRISTRNAPHNLYLFLQPALDAVIERDAEALDTVGWVFAADPPPGEELCPPGFSDCVDPGTAITIRMSGAYLTGWEYDEAAGRYRRFQTGEPFLVTGEGRIGAANVVVLATRHYIGASGYPETDVVTEDARAVILRDGRRYEARWRKPTVDAPIELLTLDGAPFPLAPGPTWVHLPAETSMPEPIHADVEAAAG